MKAKLTLRLVQSAKAQSEPYEIWDTDIKGLLLRVQPSGIRTFYTQWGRGKRTAVGKFPVITVDAARTQAKTILAQVATTGAPASAKPQGKSLTWKDFLDKHYEPWVTAERKAGAATISNLRAQFSGFYKRPLEEITALRVEKFKATRLTAGVSPVTVNRDLDRIRAALNKAVEWKFIDSNPVATVKRSKVLDEPRVRYLNPAEEKRLRDALTAREKQRREARKNGNAHAQARGLPTRPLWAKDQYTDHLVPLVLLAMNTGLRRGDLLGLTWEAVDLQEKRLRVAAASSKSSRVNFIPLNSEAVAVLTSLHKHATPKTGLVFPGQEGAPLTHIKRSWATVVEKAELTDFHFHDLRHHFASRLVMLGTDIYSVQKLLCHSNLEMTQRYAHLSADHKQQAVERLVEKNEKKTRRRKARVQESSPV